MLLADTREEIEDRLSNGRRVRFQKVVDSSVEESADEGAEHSRTLKRKLDQVHKENKERNASKQGATSAALGQIMADKQKKRLPMGEPAPKRPSSSGSNKAPSSCRQCVSLLQENQALRKEAADLRRLNMRLQKEMLDKFKGLGPLFKAASRALPPKKMAPPPTLTSSSKKMAPLTPSTVTSSSKKTAQPPPPPPNTPPPVPAPLSSATPPPRDNPRPQARDYVAVNGQVDLGAGILIPNYKIDSMSQTKFSLVVKNLAVAVFGTTILRQSSVTGTLSNHFKDRVVRPGLDPAKLQALKDCFLNHLEKEPISPETVRKEIAQGEGLYPRKNGRSEEI